MKKPFVKTILTCISLLISINISSASEIVVIKGKDVESYNSVMSGFKKVVKGNIHESNMNGDIKKWIGGVDKSNTGMADVVVSLGAEAFYMASQNIKTIPVIFSLVTDPARYTIGNSNITGVRLDIPLKTQFRFHREILPWADKIGILYSSKNTNGVIEEAKLMANESGIEVLSFMVKDIKEIPRLMEEVLAKVNSIWLLFDPVVTSSEMVVQKVIIFQALQKKIPVIGFNKWSVTAGALYCLYNEYEDIGKQTGEMVNRILDGEAPSSILIESPRGSKILFNKNVYTRIATKKRVNIPENAEMWDWK